MNVHFFYTIGLLTVAKETQRQRQTLTLTVLYLFIYLFQRMELPGIFKHSLSTNDAIMLTLFSNILKHTGK